MQACFPGKPQATLQAVSVGRWEGQHLVVYISGSTVVVLGGPTQILQTITHDDTDILEAVALNEATAKIATCTKSKIFVYKQIGLGAGDIRWAVEHELIPKCNDQLLACLSWGLPRELLTGGERLSLFDTSAHAQETWNRELANPVKFAAFTPDAAFIASTGWHDKLVKIWRRLFVGEGEERFDVSYLYHPETVTSIRWHRRPDQNYHSDTVLYTTCKDLKLRIWAATDHHGLSALQLWSELDLIQSIIPQSPPPKTAVPQRFVFILDGWEFESTVEHAIHRGGGEDREEHTREHLMDVAFRNPDVCFIADDAGNMSAWGLERVGCKARQPNDIFNIAIMESVEFRLWNRPRDSAAHVNLFYFGGAGDGSLNVLVHDFGGQIEWLSSPVDRLLAPTPQTHRFTIEASWSGHSEVVTNLFDLAIGGWVASTSEKNEIVLWRESPNTSTKLLHQGSFSVASEVRAAKASPNGSKLALIVQSELLIFSLVGSQPKHIASRTTELPGGKCYLVSTNSPENLWQLAVFASGSSRLWTVSGGLDSVNIDENKEPPSLFDDDVLVDIACSDGLVTATTLSASGMLSIQRMDLLNYRHLDHRQLTDTAIMKAHALSVHKGLAAIVHANTSTFSVWDVENRQLLFERSFEEHETIHDLTFCRSSETQNSFIAAFSHKILVFSPKVCRDYDASDLWQLHSTIELRGATANPILKCLWLAHDFILCVAGHQLFVFDTNNNVAQESHNVDGVHSELLFQKSLKESAAFLQALVPSYHFQNLLETVFIGKFTTVDAILYHLRRTLRYWAAGDPLSSSIGVQELYSGIEGSNDPNGNPDFENDEPPLLLDDATNASLLDTIGSLDLPHLTRSGRDELSVFVDCFGALSKHRKALDSPGLRYLTMLGMHQRNKDQTALGSKAFAWALHSGAQDILTEQTTRTFQGRLLWQNARDCGMSLWLRDNEALLLQFENIARNEYTKGEDRNPVDCSIYYLALRKKQVLVGLWRMATWNKEGKATQKMLANNFDDPRWKTAAMKNAYALLGRRRFEYAAAFFLLGDSLKDAVNILASQVGDLHLAIAVARVYEGDNGPVFRSLVLDRLLPEAIRVGDRWLASTAFWLVGQKHQAMRALLEPLENIMTTTLTLTFQARHFSKNEPSLAVFYAFLRDSILASPGSTAPILSAREEHRLVLRSAMNYWRLGLYNLSLSLVCEWRFLPPEESFAVPKMGSIPEPRQAEEQTVNGLEDKSSEDGEAPMYARGQRKRVIEEPSAASIMDNFDF